jgi:hypothetical protein
MTTKGPLIILAINHSPTPPTARAREMSTDALRSTLIMWRSALSRWGHHRGAGAAEFRGTARLQAGRCKRELKRREKEQEEDRESDDQPR